MNTVPLKYTILFSERTCKYRCLLYMRMFCKKWLQSGGPVRRHAGKRRAKWIQAPWFPWFPLQGLEDTDTHFQIFLPFSLLLTLHPYISNTAYIDPTKEPIIRLADILLFIGQWITKILLQIVCLAETLYWLECHKSVYKVEAKSVSAHAEIQSSTSQGIILMTF